MEFLELAKERFAVRNYKEQQIEQEKLDKILEAAQVAPTAANYQAQRIYVLQSEEALAKIRSITRCAFNAPTVMMVGYDADEDWKNALEEGVHSGEQDASIVATHMMLEAWELGIGSCWVNVFPNTETAEKFGLPDNIKLVLLMPMGYPADNAVPSPKHSIMKDVSEFTQML